MSTLCRPLPLLARQQHIAASHGVCGLPDPLAHVTPRMTLNPLPHPLSPHNVRINPPCGSSRPLYSWALINPRPTLYAPPKSLLIRVDVEAAWPQPTARHWRGPRSFHYPLQTAARNPTPLSQTPPLAPPLVPPNPHPPCGSSSCRYSCGLMVKGGPTAGSALGHWGSRMPTTTCRTKRLPLYLSFWLTRAFRVSSSGECGSAAHVKRPRQPEAQPPGQHRVRQATMGSRNTSVTSSAPGARWRCQWAAHWAQEEGVWRSRTCGRGECGCGVVFVCIRGQTTGTELAGCVKQRERSRNEQEQLSEDLGVKEYMAEGNGGRKAECQGSMVAMRHVSTLGLPAAVGCRDPTPLPATHV